MWTNRVAIGAAAAMLAAPVAAQLPPPSRAKAKPLVRLRLEKLPSVPLRPFRVDDPEGNLRTGFGGALVDVFPLGNKLHLSAGGRLVRRSPAGAAGEPLRLLPPATRTGVRVAQRFAPAFLVGYGRPAEEPLSLGLDAGVVLGPALPTLTRVDRPGRDDGGSGVNGLARMTMQLRF